MVQWPFYRIHMLDHGINDHNREPNTGLRPCQEQFLLRDSSKGQVIETPALPHVFVLTREPFPLDFHLNETQVLSLPDPDAQAKQIGIFAETEFSIRQP